MKGHLKHMLIGGAAILAILLVAGVDLKEALPWALLLACPLMMVAMMFMMNRKGESQTHQHGSSAPSTGETESRADRADISLRPPR